MSEIITQTVARKEDDEADRIINLELLGDPCGNMPIPFDPESHGLSADFQLTKFADPLRKSLQLERQEEQSLLELFDEKEVIFTRNAKESWKTRLNVYDRDNSRLRLIVAAGFNYIIFIYR